MSGISRRSLQQIADSLSPRDWAIIRFLSRQKFATTTQLRRSYFTGHATTGGATRATLRVLDRLHEHRLIARLERRVGGTRHGSAGFIWHLDVAGERLTRPKGAARRHIGDPTLTFVDHTLAVTETVVTLHELTRDSDLQLTALQVETGAWRSFLTRHGTTTILKPDLFATLSTPEYDDHWYLEIDRGTESLPVLLQKCRTYASYKATGRAQLEHGVFPRVLWIVPTTPAVQRLTSAIHTDPKLPDRLFTVITPDQLTNTIAPSETESSGSGKEEPRAQKHHPQRSPRRNPHVRADRHRSAQKRPPPPKARCPPCVTRTTPSASCMASKRPVPPSPPTSSCPTPTSPYPTSWSASTTAMPTPGRPSPSFATTFSKGSAGSKRWRR